MQEKWGRQVVPVELPIVDAARLSRRGGPGDDEGFLYQPDGNGRGEAGKIPAALEADAKAAHEALVELVAEGKDELMEEFFREGTIPEEHLITSAA